MRFYRYLLLPVLLPVLSLGALWPDPASADMSLGDKYLHCSAMFYVTSSSQLARDNPGNAMSRSERSRLMHELGMHFYLAQHRKVTQHQLNKVKEVMLSELQSQYGAGNIGRLVEGLTICTCWSDVINGAMATGLGEKYKTALKNRDWQTVQFILQYKWSEPPQKDVEKYAETFTDRHRIIETSFIKWKDTGFITPEKMKKRSQTR